MADRNASDEVIADFGKQWTAYDQAHLPVDMTTWNAYFSIFPWHLLPRDARGFDCGCGHGRFEIPLAPRVGEMHCVDPSDALDVARKNLAGFPNVYFHRATSADMPFADDSMDFGISLGVLHHIPDTARGVADCVRKLKPGAPFLLYLYYAFDNRPAWYRLVWKVSDVLRRSIARLPFAVKNAVCTAIAALVYWPFARLAGLCDRLGIEARNLPLRTAGDKPFYILRANSLDRFGTRLEQRFTRAEIRQMLVDAGCSEVTFSDQVPYWVGVGIKAPAPASAGRPPSSVGG